MNEKEEEKNIWRLINKQLSIEIYSVSFDKIKPSLVVFNKDGNSCTIITTCEEKESEFKNLNNLYNSQNISIKNNETLRNSRKLNKFFIVLSPFFFVYPFWIIFKFCGTHFNFYKFI